ncbi:flavodoxin domain-containing protein [Thiomicrorhabdus sp.]|uniref:flavodoxin domain-containing protein n=1 Tax=Thiomicrorhabdus sp. TaxID=2039724 RepID=UPI0035659BE0
MKYFKAASSVYVVYASSRGTTKALAEDFARRCQVLGIRAELLCLNALTEENFSKSSVVFFIGSKGNGELPENGEAFFDSSQFAKSDLSNMRYAIFALGSRYCGQRSWAGKKLHLAFKSEQAGLIAPPVFAEDGYQKLYASWAHEVLSELCGMPIDELPQNLVALSVPARQATETTFSSTILGKDYA